MFFLFKSPKTAKELANICKTPSRLAWWLHYRLWYKSDEEKHGFDKWQTPEETLKDRTGDCLEENTYILTESGKVKIKDISIGDKVLSYNYDKKCFEFKRVIRKWDKGILDGYKIRLSNRHNVIATGEHKFFCSESQKDRQRYKVKRLDDIDLTRYWKKRLHCVSCLPCGNIHIDGNEAYLYGIYISEGYAEQYKVCIAQDKKDICRKIESALTRLNVPFSESKRERHHYYTILKGEFKEKLKALGTNSFNMTSPKDVLNWDKTSTQKFLEGLLDGDGGTRERIKTDNSLWEFSTSSDEIAYAFNILVRKVYGNCWFDYVLCHGGCGKRPIYRIRYNPNSCFNREIFDGVSLVSIREKTAVSDLRYYDIEVEDNHNFVLADSGVISHNCDDFSILAKAVLEHMGIKAFLLGVYTWKGYARSDSKGHMVAVFYWKNRYWHISNWGLKPSVKTSEKVDPSEKLYEEISGTVYKNAKIWRIFNENKKELQNGVRSTSSGYMPFE